MFGTGIPTIGSVPVTDRVFLGDVSLYGPMTGSSSSGWVNVAGGYTPAGWPGHKSNHIKNSIPIGGNLVMLDGHVEWRKFIKMSNRTPPDKSPQFWW
jgi:prepilin-type processing-associated H-X9-DG protein